MTSETDMDRRGRFVTSKWPWLLGAVMLALFVLTLNRSVTYFSLERLADVSGWNWRLNRFGPLALLFTYPMRWLPESITLVVMNMFSAVCASLVLVLLARSVALLPHDRTSQQRDREPSESSILTIRLAWLPPLVAVLVCGLQITFWEHAIEFRKIFAFDTGQMLNLLLFAYVIRCLLEYRISRKESWLTRWALVYGLGMANNWAMIAFLPAFLVALVWIKGFEFFKWRFLLGMLACGALGFCLILLIPVTMGLSDPQHLRTFWTELVSILRADKFLLLHFDQVYPGFSRLSLLLLCLTSILPVFLIGIKWAASFGDNSRLGIFMATSIINIVHAFFLLICLWVALDPPFGPRQVNPSAPFLTFYYLGALAIGYFTGYFLLIFGAKPLKMRRGPHPLVRWFNRSVVAGVCLVSIAGVLALVAKNVPLLRQNRAVADAFANYFTRVEESLPPKSTVVVSDDSFLLFYLQATQAGLAKKGDRLLVDTSALAYSWSYLRFLDRRNPQFKLSREIKDVTRGRPENIECVKLLETLADSNEVYYLHPSFGYYFERFYPQPDGLVYHLQKYPVDTWIAPVLAPEQLAKNQKFWNQEDGALTSVILGMKPPQSSADPNLWERFLKSALLTPETNTVSSLSALYTLLGRYYSRPLNYWGVELQKYGRIDEAGKRFEKAQLLSPDNTSARINLRFNQQILAGVKPVLEPIKSYEHELGNHFNWLQVLNMDGPLDHPSFCGALAVDFLSTNSGCYRQSIQQFKRQEALLPDDPAVPLQLSRSLLYIASQPHVMSYSYPPATQTCSDAAAAADRAHRLAPNDSSALLLKSLASIQLGSTLEGAPAGPKFPSPAHAYSNALNASETALFINPSEPNALFFKGVALIQLGLHEQAIAPLDQLLAVQTNHLAGFLNRAIVHLKLNHLDAAKQDYETVAKTSAPNFQVFYGLGEVAYRQRDFPAAIKNYETYLSTLPASLQNSEEARAVQTRLKELKN